MPLPKPLCNILRAGLTLTAVLALYATAGIHLNSVGFLPDFPKRASVREAPSTGSVTFTINRADNGEAVFNGNLGSFIRNNDSRDTVRIADFTAFTEPGRYYIEVDGVGRSPEFNIAGDAFNEAFKTMMLGMYLWRCGSPNGVDATFNGTRFHHAPCHQAPARLCHPRDATAGAPVICVGNASDSDTRDASGGWHDAGDFNKYVVNSGITVGLMLKAWEHFGETIGQIPLIASNNAATQYEAGIPQFLSEVKWNLDWVAKMQHGPDDGRVSHKLSTRNFCGMDVMPHEETEPQYFVSWSTSATGAFVAMLAQASRIYRQYDSELADRWLAQARISYETLEEHPSNVAPLQSWFLTGAYVQGSADPSYRLWAAVEMWEATGESKFLEYFEATARTGLGGNIGTHLGWADVSIMAAMTYLASDRPGKSTSVVNSMRSAVISAANSIESATSGHGYAHAFNGQSYYWGSHGALTANTYILNTAYQLTSEARYRRAGHEILGHIFGRNYFGRSFVTGVGHNPPQFPHDRRSHASGFGAWPGYLIGGPHSGNLREANGDPIAPPGATCATQAVCYFDVMTDYARNEIAINWNASMIYALSGFLAAPENGSRIVTGRTATTARPAAPKVTTTRLIQVRNGRSSIIIPQGARVYSLDGRLVAHRKVGDMNAPVIRRNGMFIMRVENK